MITISQQPVAPVPLHTACLTTTTTTTDTAPNFSRADSNNTTSNTTTTATGLTTESNSLPTTISKDVSASASSASKSSFLSSSSASHTTATGNDENSDSKGLSSLSLSPRIVLGMGTINRLPTELERLGITAPLIVSSPSRIALARRIQSLIPSLDSRILDSALVNVPVRVVDDAVERITGRDCVLSVGGSSAVELAKAIASRKDIPHVCIPTTSSGAEMPYFKDCRRSQSGRVKGQKRSQSRPRKGNSYSVRNERQGGSGSGSGTGSSESQKSRHRESRTMPTVIIYDEDLASNVPRRFSAPTSASIMMESRSRSSSDDDAAQWSYLHLPGV